MHRLPPPIRWTRSSTILFSGFLLIIFLIIYVWWPLAQQVLSLVLQQKTVYSTTEQGANKILEWLNGTTWDDFDQIIVRDAIEGSPDILNFLERAVSRDMINRVTPPSLGGE